MEEEFTMQKRPQKTYQWKERVELESFSCKYWSKAMMHMNSASIGHGPLEPTQSNYPQKTNMV